MKYYSEKLNKTFDTAEECRKAELDFDNAQLSKEMEEVAKDVEKKSKSKEKKELVKKIEAASESVKAAKDEYQKAREKAAKILEYSNREIEKLLNAAEDKVREAKKAEFEAIAEFNERFGPYVRQYTADTMPQINFIDPFKWFFDQFKF